MSWILVGLLARLSVDWALLSASWKEVPVHYKTASFYLPDCLQWAVKKSQTFFFFFLTVVSHGPSASDVSWPAAARAPESTLPSVKAFSHTVQNISRSTAGILCSSCYKHRHHEADFPTLFKRLLSRCFSFKPLAVTINMCRWKIT